ncbi:hypothetical protein CPB84DRAFT_1785251, partial [Gymnopilus junonius]
MNPFSRRLSLPFLAVINEAVPSLVTFQFVRRYPLIFGSWCKQLDVERQFFGSIYASISRVLGRSQNSDFRGRSEELLQLLQGRVASSSDAAATTLSNYLKAVEGTVSLQPSLCENTEEAFILSMASFYHLGLKRPLFKVLLSSYHLRSTNLEMMYAGFIRFLHHWEGGRRCFTRCSTFRKPGLGQSIRQL